jgi:hypothetical protein
MSNTLITNDIIAKLVLMEFKNNLVLAKTCNRQYQNLFDNTTGRTIRIRKPTRLLSAEGAILVTQNIEQRNTNLTIDHRRHVGITLTSEELTLQLNDFQANVIRPAMQELANQVDMSLYNAGVPAFYNYVGTPGTSPNSLQTVIDAGSKLDSFGIPSQDRFLIMSTKDGGVLKGALGNVFNSAFNSKILLDSAMGRVAGFDAYTAQNVLQPTAASAAFGTPLVNGAGQSGTSLIVDGLTAGMTIYAGCLFQIAGVYAVNPISRVSTTQLANFVVASDVTADGSGNATLTITPGTQLTGPYQNVTALPANNAAITFQSTHTKNLAYQKEAFTLAMINLYTPKSGVVFAKNMVDASAGVALRMIRQYDINTDEDKVRVDALWGVKAFGEYGDVVMGS